MTVGPRPTPDLSLHTQLRSTHTLRLAPFSTLLRPTKPLEAPDPRVLRSSGGHRAESSTCFICNAVYRSDPRVCITRLVVTYTDAYVLKYFLCWRFFWNCQNGRIQGVSSLVDGFFLGRQVYALTLRIRPPINPPLPIFPLLSLQGEGGIELRRSGVEIVRAGPQAAGRTGRREWGFGRRGAFIFDRCRWVGRAAGWEACVGIPEECRSLCMASSYRNSLRQGFLK